MPNPALLMLTEMLPLVEAQLKPQFEIHDIWRSKNPEALLKKVAPEIEAICSFNPPFSPTSVPASMIEMMPRLKIIAHKGVGYDSVDAAAAARRGIVVTNTPDVLTEEVADLTLGLLVMTVRELSAAERWLREGKWATAEFHMTPLSLRGRKVGIVGLGRIGKAIARRVTAFGLPVSYFGRRRQADVPYAYYDDIVALARDVDTLIVVIPGGTATKHLIDARVLEALGKNGVLINVARGSVVDEAALMAALHEKRIAAAGLDVFQNEPKFDQAFLRTPNTVLLPHVGSNSIATRSAMAQLVVDNLLAYRQRKPPLTLVPETPFKGW
jgi:lactate dehydrogenase-like 2-hydroxyacid dehydrogenase